MPESLKRKRGAQPGNKNASKGNRQAKAAFNVEPMPAEMGDLIDLEVRLLTHLMANLEKRVEEQDRQEEPVPVEETRKTIRAVSYASLATLRILKAKQLFQSDTQLTLQDYLDRAIDELNNETQEQQAARIAARDARPSPFPPLTPPSRP